MRAIQYLLVPALLALAAPSGATDENLTADGEVARWTASPVVAKVRQATAAFRDVSVALAAGYIDTGHCVSGGAGGAMGVHFVNLELMFDGGSLDIATPEVLVYEPLADGSLRLIAAEYFSLDDGDPSTGSPVLEGHLFHYLGAPNRYGLPPGHELHVWAWKRNPNGTFADFNPNVRCDAYGVSHTKQGR